MNGVWFSGWMSVITDSCWWHHHHHMSLHHSEAPVIHPAWCLFFFSSFCLVSWVGGPSVWPRTHAGARHHNNHHVLHWWPPCRRRSRRPERCALQTSCGHREVWWMLTLVFQGLCCEAENRLRITGACRERLAGWQRLWAKRPQDSMM